MHVHTHTYACLARCMYAYVLVWLHELVIKRASPSPIECAESKGKILRGLSMLDARVRCLQSIAYGTDMLNANESRLRLGLGSDLGEPAVVVA